MSDRENWFENGRDRVGQQGSGPESFADAARLGDTGAVERGLRSALQASPLPVADPVAALLTARARGARIVRRRQALTVAAAALAIVGATGAGLLAAGRFSTPSSAPSSGPAGRGAPVAAGPTKAAAGPALAGETPSPASSVRTIYTSAVTLPPPPVRPTVAPPTTPTPYIVVHTPCATPSKAPANAINRCIIGGGTGYYVPSTWKRYGDLTVLATAIGTDDFPRSVSQSADGGVIAASGDGGWIEVSTVTADGTSIDKQVRIGDPRGPVDAAQGDYRWAPAVSVHPGGQLLAASWSDGAVMLWDISEPASPRRLQTVGPTSMYTTDVLFSPDGSTLATAGYDNKVRLYRVTGERLVPGAVLSVRSDALSLAWSGDGTRLAGASYDETSVWDTSNPDHPKLVSLAPSKTMGQIDVALSPDGSVLYTTGVKAGVYDVTRPVARRLRGLDPQLDGLTVDPSGGELATLDRKGQLTLYAADRGALRRTVSGRFPEAIGADSRGMVFDTSGTRLAVLSFGTSVVLIGNG